MTCQPFHVLLSLYMWHLSQTSKILIRKKEHTIVCVKIRAWIVNALRSFVTRVVCAKILAPFFPFPSQFQDNSTFYLSLCRIKHTEIKHLFKNRTFYAANCVGSDELELQRTYVVPLKCITEGWLPEHKVISILRCLGHFFGWGKV